jgi:hypothetical protein
MDTNFFVTIFRLLIGKDPDGKYKEIAIFMGVKISQLIAFLGTIKAIELIYMIAK